MEAYRRYGPALRRQCERILGDQAEAEDVVQGIFVDLLRKGRGEVDLPYLYRAATTRCLNRIRDRKRRAALLDRHGDALVGADPGHPEARAISQQLLLRLLDRLDDRSAEILVYRYLERMTGDEIALLLGISRRAVTKRLARVKETLDALDPGGWP